MVIGCGRVWLCAFGWLRWIVCGCLIVVDGLRLIAS